MSAQKINPLREIFHKKKWISPFFYNDYNEIGEEVYSLQPERYKAITHNRCINLNRGVTWILIFYSCLASMPSSWITI